MDTLHIDNAPTHADIDWAPFSGGELEAPRPRATCPVCRAQAGRAAAAGQGAPTLCFQCYRTELDRTRRLKAAANLNTASEARFQTALPFEPVNQARLARLKAERQASQARAGVGTGVYARRRRRAQIDARHALRHIFLGLKERHLVDRRVHTSRQAAFAQVVQAAELQLPESWLPFVVSQ